MNRIIKFRAWDKTNNIMYQFINSTKNWSFGFLNQDIFIWLQYTGLKDKNGKEIYEGDILKALNGRKGEVRFQNGGFEWCDEPLGWDFDAPIRPEKYNPENWSEVIGNIFENSELFKK